MNMQVDPREIIEAARVSGSRAAWQSAAEQLLALAPKPKAPPKSKFDPRATLGENLLQHGAPAPWQSGKKRPTGKSVVVRVTFADGETQTMSTYHKVAKGGDADVDGVVRAARESKMRRTMLVTLQPWEPEYVGRVGVRIETPRRTWSVYHCKIPTVVSAEVVG